MSYLIRHRPVTKPTPLTLSVLSEEPDFDALEYEWRELYECSLTATTPLKWEWMREWWRFLGTKYGKEPGGLKIYTLRHGARLVGVLPFYLKAGKAWRPTTLGFLSSGEEANETTYPEYLNILCAPGYEEECCDRVLNTVLQNTSWDTLNLGILNPASPLVRRLKNITVNGTTINWTEHSCYQANIEGGLSHYLERLKPSVQQRLRRLLKQRVLPELSFSAAQTMAQADDFFDCLVTLHQKRWIKAGYSGAFSSQSVIDFHRALIRKLLSKREVILTKLALGSEPIAVIYGFKTGSKFDFYQCGIHYDHSAIKSPGIFAHLLTMDHLAQHRIHTYDFLGGNDDYKKRLSTIELKAFAILLRRRTLRCGIAATLEAYKKASRRFTDGVIPFAKHRHPWHFHDHYHGGS